MSDKTVATVHRLAKKMTGTGSSIAAMKGVLIWKITEKKCPMPNPVARKVVGNTSAKLHSWMLYVPLMPNLHIMTNTVKNDDCSKPSSQIA